MIDVYKDGVILDGLPDWHGALMYSIEHMRDVMHVNSLTQLSERTIGGEDGVKRRSFICYQHTSPQGLCSVRYELRLRDKYFNNVEERFPVGMKVESVNKNHGLSEPTYVLAHHLPYNGTNVSEMLLGDLRGNVRSVWGHDIVDDVVTPTGQVVTLVDGRE